MRGKNVFEQFQWVTDLTIHNRSCYKKGAFIFAVKSVKLASVGRAVCQNEVF